jgi:hypothetical protein
MSDHFDPAAMIERFAQRASAVKGRSMPPIEGPDRQAFIERSQQDFMDYAMLADAKTDLTDGILTLTIDLRPNPS